MLSRSAPRGFTLVEIMLSLVMMLVVGGAIYQLLFVTQRLTRIQTERIALQSSVRGAALVVSNELRENEILRIGPQAISYRAMRGFGYACQPSGRALIQIARKGYSGYRDPQAGRDSVLIYAEGVPTPADTGWIPLGITSVSTAGSCPGPAPGITLTVAGSPALGGIVAGTPVRIYEQMELASYRSQGRFWLGLRSISAGEAIQPLFGPLADRDGLVLGYSDGAGRATAVPEAVSGISISLSGVTETVVPGLQGQWLTEQLTALVALRNAAR